MPGSAFRSVFTRYAVAWFYLTAVTATEIISVLLSHRDWDNLLTWASTSVHNLRHDPVGSLIVSAFARRHH